MKKNALVAQSGGPSPVINASLQGVIEACRSYPEKIDRLYAAYHGIEGVLLEELIDIYSQDMRELDILKFTPASGVIGTCRYKLKEKGSTDFQRIIDVIKAHNIGYFFYIGGNDSMDTAHKVSEMAREQGIELIVAGVPKTIDNDIGDDKFTIIDHTPGYGSCARYWALMMQNANQENLAINVSECVSVYQAMGRTTGYITAAARLSDPKRENPLLMFFTETGANLEFIAEKVNEQLKKTKRCIVVVNEGLDVGDIEAKHDGFGHIEYAASGSSAMQSVVNYLNSMKLNARGQATGQIPGCMQRSVSIYASTIDIDEALQLGRHAVRVAMETGTGYMSTLLRHPGEEYRTYLSHVPLDVVANSQRHLPKDWITPEGTDVTDDFLRYARPLIGEEWPAIPMENGLQRFAKFDIRFIDKKLPYYKPLNM